MLCLKSLCNWQSVLLITYNMKERNASSFGKATYPQVSVQFHLIIEQFSESIEVSLSTCKRLKKKKLRQKTQEIKKQSVNRIICLQEYK